VYQEENELFIKNPLTGELLNRIHAPQNLFVKIVFDRVVLQFASDLQILTLPEGKVIYSDPGEVKKFGHFEEVLYTSGKTARLIDLVHGTLLREFKTDTIAGIMGDGSFIVSKIDEQEKRQTIYKGVFT
jgi:hypothetical protein